MNALRVIRRLAALVLLAALFLPLSRCSKQDGGAADQASPVPSQTYRYFYAWTDFQAGSVGSWLIFLAFLWPIPFLAHEWTRRDRPAPMWLSAAQLPLAAGAITLVYSRTFLNQLWVGGYLAYIALGSYAAVLIAEIGIRIVRAAGTPRTAPGEKESGP